MSCSTRGEHLFEVRGRDVNGLDGEVASLTVGVDLAAPDASAELWMDGPTLCWAPAADTFGVASYQWRVDGGDWTDTTALSVETGLAPGQSAFFEVRAVDLVDHVGAIASATLEPRLGPQRGRLEPRCRCRPGPLDRSDVQRAD